MTVETAPAPSVNADTTPAPADALVGQLLSSLEGVWDIFSVYIGEKLGLYRKLAEIEPATSGELAGALNLNERYIREWLEQQTVSNVLAVEDATSGPTERRFYTPDGHHEVLVDTDHPNYFTPFALIGVGAVSPIARLLEIYRTGEGLHFHDFGEDMREGQGGANRNLFLTELGTDILPAIPELHARLKADPPARIADIGCGVGWSSIGMARAYPNVRIQGFDLDEPSVHDAQRNIQDFGVEDRVTIEYRDAGDPSIEGHFDLVTAFECIHDMPDPVTVLQTMRRLAGDAGTVLVMDERVGETFTPTGNDVERLMYGYSIFHCLPVGMAGHGAVGTGTVMRPSTLRGYALEAGFRDVEILPISNVFFNFYRLTR